MAITNGNQFTIAQLPNNVPNISSAIQGWMQPLTFETLVTTVGPTFESISVPTTVATRGVWQPQTPQSIQMKPEGQRAWKWFTLHAEIGLILSIDDVVLYQAVQYRVKTKTDYSLYGYVQYELIDDFTGSGP